MKTKNVIAYVLVVMLLVAFAVSSFADARSTSSASYSAGKVKHKFTTSAYLSKSSSEKWTQIVDVPSYSCYCREGSDIEDLAAAYHRTYLVDGNGNKLSDSYKDIWLGGTGVFSSDELKESTSTAAHLLIYNPKYGTEWYLKTAGTFNGTAS